ncbi:hypothetical protein AB0B89_24130 [Sphaerisporangium sp. NPDC049002]|uniref:hypothetical protein n=1 Tax=Sphaerisporangium sp. NPDC049002 TaxID=3155392 RepID=UPI0033EAE0E8
MTADAETAPLPKITAEEPPPLPTPPPVKRSLISRLGDLPMRVIYRGVASALAVLAVVTAGVVFFATGSHKGTPSAAGPTGGEPLATLPAPSSGASEAPPVSAEPSALSASGASSMPSLSASGASSVPSVSGSAAVVPSVPASASGPSEVSAQGSASPVPTPGSSALATAQADPRVPPLPADRKLADFRGRAAPAKGRVKDRRSGVTFTRFTKAWKLTKSSPFSTRRTLPAVKGAGHRALLASCPVPIAVQEDLKDTAFLAARWTLNYHPVGSKITWTASQPIKAGKQKGWLLGYRVSYKAGGKKHVSTAAVALVEVSSSKPALVFITIPDAQKKRWADINTVMSSVRAL